MKPTRDLWFQMVQTQHLYFSLGAVFLTDPAAPVLTRSPNRSPELERRPHSGPILEPFPVSGVGKGLTPGAPSAQMHKSTLACTHVSRQHPRRENQGSHLPLHCSKWITDSLTWPLHLISQENNGWENIIILNRLWYSKAPVNTRRLRKSRITVLGVVCGALKNGDAISFLAACINNKKQDRKMGQTVWK